MTKEQIHTAIENGQTVNWHHNLYEIQRVKVKDSNKHADASRVNGYGLRINCIVNGFGSLLSENCLDNCFIK